MPQQVSQDQRRRCIELAGSGNAENRTRRSTFFLDYLVLRACLLNCDGGTGAGAHVWGREVLHSKVVVCFQLSHHLVDGGHNSIQSFLVEMTQSAIGLRE